MKKQSENETRKERVNIRMSPSLKAALERMASKEQRTLSATCQRILSQHVDKVYAPDSLKKIPKSTKKTQRSRNGRRT